MTFFHINFSDIIYIGVPFWLGWLARGKWASFRRKAAYKGVSQG